MSSESISVTDILSDWANEFPELYPSAKIHLPTEKHRAIEQTRGKQLASNREKLKRSKTNLANAENALFHVGIEDILENYESI